MAQTSLSPKTRSDSRAWVRLLNRPPEDPDCVAVVSALDAWFNDKRMVGHIEIELAREREGWRVVSAQVDGVAGSDRRAEVIECLRAASIDLAH